MHSAARLIAGLIQRSAERPKTMVYGSLSNGEFVVTNQSPGLPWNIFMYSTVAQSETVISKEVELLKLRLQVGGGLGHV